MSFNSISRRGLSEFFDQQCPNDSKFYACSRSSKSKFVGCCKIDPCELATGCTITNLQPLSFNASHHGTDTFPPDPECGSVDIKPYTCAQPKGTFWGCCKTVPCANTPPSCPEGDLFPASLKTDLQFDAYTGSSDSSKEEPAKDDGHVSTGIIAGATVGGVVVIVAIVAILIFCLCKKRKNKSKENAPATAAVARGDIGDKTDYRASALTEAPPVYSSPNPNDGTFYSGPHKPYDQNQKGVYQQVAQAPMELSGESSYGGGQAASNNFVAELPSDHTTLSPASPAMSQHKPVELESPLMSPAHPATPHNNPAKFQEVMDVKK
ncbi:unnamed protein product [Periconia digitata]|uniref:Uncharacterized protein n=1 Tax=Periconia digitata TaxID=1303443 RepID=A0A9W4UTY8_9PLEO|nr:unnamed protein product [Periconia digitata]